MSLSARTELVFGVKGSLDLSEEEEDSLIKLGIIVSPYAYRCDEKTGEVIVGISLATLRNVGETENVSNISEFTEKDKVNMREKIVEALNKIDVDIPENKKFGIYMNSFYC